MKSIMFHSQKGFCSNYFTFIAIEITAIILQTMIRMVVIKPNVICQQNDKNVSYDFCLDVIVVVNVLDHKILQ